MIPSVKKLLLSVMSLGINLQLNCFYAKIDEYHAYRNIFNQIK